VARQLAEEHAAIVISDPKALGNAQKDLGDLGNRVEFEQDPYKAVAGAHAIAIMTEWAIYKELDYARIFSSMEKPAFVFDGRNILNHRKLHDLGFNVFAIGKTPLKHF
jgi:UDPglucose 6-dehydrogenase